MELPARAGRRYTQAASHARLGRGMTYEEPLPVVTAGRLRKRLSRALMVSWRDQPTRYDIEALQANIRRVGLVIRVRWTLLIVLILYSLAGGIAYTTRISPIELAELMAVPAMALGFVVLYNSFYALNYKRLGNIAVWNNLQLGLDAIVVTVLVYFSGGVNSWFWSMYALFILEAAFILPKRSMTWLHAIASCLLLGAVEFTELFSLVPHMHIPFAEIALHTDPVFVQVRYSWQVAVLLGTAWVVTQLVGEFRRELAVASAQTLVDSSTSLYSRSYFMRSAVVEIRRSQRDNRAVHVILVDLDNFGEFNSLFGIDAGDRMLQGVATAISNAVSEAGDLSSSTNVVARYGGEEFAVLFAEDFRVEGAPTHESALHLAEQVRAAVASVVVGDKSVTASVGVASVPLDAIVLDELLDSADAALTCAIERGGNTVVAAQECPLVESEGELDAEQG